MSSDPSEPANQLAAKEPLEDYARIKSALKGVEAPESSNSIPSQTVVDPVVKRPRVVLQREEEADEDEEEEEEEVSGGEPPQNLADQLPDDSEVSLAQWMRCLRSHCERIST